MLSAMLRPLSSTSLALFCGLCLASCSEGGSIKDGDQTKTGDETQPTGGEEGSASGGSDGSSTPGLTSGESGSSASTDTGLTGSTASQDTTSGSSGSGNTSSSGTTQGTATATSTKTSTDTSTPSTNGCGPEVMISATFRDFSVRDENGKLKHPDFESFGGSGTTGLVETQLNAQNKPVAALPIDATQMTSQENFAQWYTDVAGVNYTFKRELKFVETEPEIYEYKSNAFFPIGPNEGWGKQQHEKNYGFTTEIAIDFIYRPNQTFAFTGDDDLWIFIDGKLALDLGGLHAELSKTLNLDEEGPKLGLIHNRLYTMRIFHAERHSTGSHFKVKSNIGCIFIPG